jgi:hypothetical protein
MTLKKYHQNYKINYYYTTTTQLPFNFYFNKTKNLKILMLAKCDFDWSLFFSNVSKKLD